MNRSNNRAAAMQKLYDECFLTCSTAIYFEGQNNEPEALRSWRSALDRIYYHNAYKMPPDYKPQSATDQALFESLRELELQCRERVTLLEALKESRDEVEESRSKVSKDAVRGPRALPRIPSSARDPVPAIYGGFIGDGTVPAAAYNSLPSPTQASAPRPQPARASVARSRSSDPSSYLRPSNPPRTHSVQQPLQQSTQPAISAPTQSGNPRSESPEKKTSMLKTTLRNAKEGKKSKSKDTLRAKPPAASKAAGLAWDSISRPASSRPESRASSGVGLVDMGFRRPSADVIAAEGPRFHQKVRPLSPNPPPPTEEYQRSRSFLNGTSSQNNPKVPPPPRLNSHPDLLSLNSGPQTSAQRPAEPQPPPPKPIAYKKPAADFLTYRNEYPAPPPVSQASIAAAINPPRSAQPDGAPLRENALPSRSRQAPPPPIKRRAVGRLGDAESSPRAEQGPRSPPADTGTPTRTTRKKHPLTQPADVTTPPSSEEEVTEGSLESKDWQIRLAYVKKHLPKGVDEGAAKQIFNEIVVQGDEVHWSDVAGLDIAKSALKEAVVYPFLRPDLFMGLREPARGMLLFGPPGTGKTMLARAVATESRSTFFAISASSLTSKWMGESEKLVRALFQLAKALAPSIIFVDEIDSLLSSRGDGEHETTRRIKTEFLIQWSDLQKAAAGKERSSGEGDATRVLVLAATNLPWAIDEAARRRFVRRQYIPLPEPHVREQQLLTLLGHQKHNLTKDDLLTLVGVTDGYSGSDITALAKDAAMGPLRSLGEALLSMTMDDIRPINFGDFEASLVNIRPSVSKDGLRQFEDWAKEFGERGG